MVDHEDSADVAGALIDELVSACGRRTTENGGFVRATRARACTYHSRSVTPRASGRRGSASSCCTKSSHAVSHAACDARERMHTGGVSVSTPHVMAHTHSAPHITLRGMAPAKAPHEQSGVVGRPRCSGHERCDANAVTAAGRACA